MSAGPSTLNLVGTPCPINFVRIKAALDHTTPGVPLAALVEAGPVGLDLAESLRMAGYDVLAVEERGDSLLLTASRRKLVSARPVPRRKDTPCARKARRRRGR